jgi:hypothetical protein
MKKIRDREMAANSRVGYRERKVIGERLEVIG